MAQEKVTLPKSCQDCHSKEKGIFCQIEEKVEKDLAEHKVTNHYKKGQTIFVQGNPSYGLFCVSQGQIKLTKVGDQGKETIVALAGPGDILGEASFFTGHNYPITATALTDASVCFLDKKYFLEIMKVDPTIPVQLMTKMSQEIESADEKIVNSHQKNVLERLATLLVDLNKKHGEKRADKSYKINLKLSREEMASLVATAPETLIRTISDLKNEGILDQDGKYIVINNLSKLQELTGSTNY